MSQSQPPQRHTELTAEELQRLTHRYDCMAQLQRALQQMGEVAFKVAIGLPGELRNTTVALLAVDPSTAVNQGQ